MYKHILIPIDGSARSSAGLAQGLGLARALGASVTVLTVYSPFRPTSMETVHLEGVHSEYVREATESAKAYLSEAAAQASAAGVPCTTEMRESSDPSQTIIDVAMTQGCDLIAMASRGHGGLTAVLLGSQTQKVMAHSTLPVIVYR
ncbi:universal stress protein [Achromobacter anxifer]|jgi:nucleotide-binding universal stress UspA family protein|uniref:TRAP-T-associated universal stress protein TeaD n=1 Tax=Achromobacter anxifer TaxID=1287737 RepID=A0A6S7BVB3_9BURK|nr:universal stress protein [Achromobacter anxifer]MDF8364946.1 universal stress protein [Achromobacter anxifer]CAB3818526.1 TRAP-T-associated universal stress protein TeaD [Achromobacter anxifer]CAB5513065.1 TRAP-T-associated universal stress protein TeaD [Achromobacter anxifer]